MENFKKQELFIYFNKKFDVALKTLVVHYLLEMNENDIISEKMLERWRFNKIDVAFLVAESAIISESEHYILNWSHPSVAQIKNSLYEETNISDSVMKLVVKESRERVDNFLNSWSNLQKTEERHWYEIYISQEISRCLNQIDLEYYSLMSLGEHRKSTIDVELIEEQRHAINLSFQSDSLPGKYYLTDVSTVYIAKHTGIPTHCLVIEVKLKKASRTAKFIDVIRLWIYMKFFNCVKNAVFIIIDEDDRNGLLDIQRISLSYFEKNHALIRKEINKYNILIIENDSFVKFNYINDESTKKEFSYLYLVSMLVSELNIKVTNYFEKMECIINQINDDYDPTGINNSELSYGNTTATLNYYVLMKEILEIEKLSPEAESNTSDNRDIIEKFMQISKNFLQDSRMFLDGFLDKKTCIKSNYIILFLSQYKNDKYNIIDRVIESMNKPKNQKNIPEADARKIIKNEIEKYNTEILLKFEGKTELLFSAIMKQISLDVGEFENRKSAGRSKNEVLLSKIKECNSNYINTVVKNMFKIFILSSSTYKNALDRIDDDNFIYNIVELRKETSNILNKKMDIIDPPFIECKDFNIAKEHIINTWAFPIKSILDLNITEVVFNDNLYKEMKSYLSSLNLDLFSLQRKSSTPVELNKIKTRIIDSIDKLESIIEEKIIDFTLNRKW